ncbi:MAG TPA: retropepsin-like aspartic protease [Chitinophagaceae bacterium]|nr:retropepsin-like aspartic protease [Chitinophagaceae bacterium]
MRKWLFTIVFLLLFRHACIAQQNMPLIRANSDIVAIKDGNQPVTRYWDHLSANVKTVVYNVSKVNKERLLTFYTDIDSVTFSVGPGQKYDFKVLLNSKDTCHAEISTVIPSYHKDCGNCIITNDTIPFTLGSDHYIHINGKINNSELLDFIFDTGASCVLLSEKGLKKVKIKLDGLTENQGTGGFSTEKTSSSNRLQLSALQWEKLPLLFINYNGALHADGVIGFNVFEDKIVEIDYDNSLMIIHSQMPLGLAGYKQSQMHHDINGSLIKLTLNNGKKSCAGWFLFDTGGDLNVAVGSDFAVKNNLYGTMKKIGTGVTGGTGSNGLTNEVDLLPQLTINGHNLHDIPIQLQNSGFSFPGNAGIVGNNVLDRFNTIINYPTATIYLKPNHLFSGAFEKSRVIWLWVTGLVILGGLIAFFLTTGRIYRLRNP